MNVQIKLTENRICNATNYSCNAIQKVGKLGIWPTLILDRRLNQGHSIFRIVRSSWINEKFEAKLFRESRLRYEILEMDAEFLNKTNRNDAFNASYHWYCSSINSCKMMSSSSKSISTSLSSPFSMSVNHCCDCIQMDNVKRQCLFERHKLNKKPNKKNSNLFIFQKCTWNIEFILSRLSDTNSTFL